MEHVKIGYAIIDKQVTPMRRYPDGMYVVEANESVVFSSDSLAGLEKKMTDAKAQYKIYDQS